VAFIPVADAIAALRAAGHCVTRTTRADAARRYGCQPALYVLDGRGVTIGRLRQLATLALEPVAAEPVAAEPVAAEPVAAEPVATEPLAPEPLAARPVLPGESLPPAPPAPHGAVDPVLPPVRTSGTVAQFRTDAMAGRPISLAGLARALAAEPVAAEPVAARPVAAAPAPTLPGFRRDAAAGRRPAPTGAAMAGQPWDPGTPEARATVALQRERVGILWPIAQTLRGEGVALPMAWQHDGPVMSGEWPLARALAALPLGAIAQAAAALAALPPVTGDQAAALSLCRTGCPGPHRPAAL